MMMVDSTLLEADVEDVDKDETWQEVEDMHGTLAEESCLKLQFVELFGYFILTEEAEPCEGIIKILIVAVGDVNFILQREMLKGVCAWGEKHEQSRIKAGNIISTSIPLILMKSLKQNKIVSCCF